LIDAIPGVTTALGGIVGSAVPGVGTGIGALAGNIAGRGIKGLFPEKFTPNIRASFKVPELPTIPATLAASIGQSGKGGNAPGQEIGQTIDIDPQSRAQALDDIGWGKSPDQYGMSYAEEPNQTLDRSPYEGNVLGARSGAPVGQSISLESSLKEDPGWAGFGPPDASMMESGGHETGGESIGLSGIGGNDYGGFSDDAGHGLG
jgi:hypothetical protein